MASSGAGFRPRIQVSAARWIASRKLPNRRRIVFSDGRIAASVQLSAVGIEPCSATNLRRAATASAIRVSAMSGSGTASPSNTPGGFALWELRSTSPRGPARVCLNVLPIRLQPMGVVGYHWRSALEGAPGSAGRTESTSDR